LEATDPRDKICGLLSLSSDGPSINPFPNHRLPVDIALSSVMKAIATSETTLDVLAMKMYGEEPEAGIPSWQQAWQRRLWNSRILEPRLWHQTCQKALQTKTLGRRKFSFEISRDIVITFGAEVDKIDGIAVGVPWPVWPRLGYVVSQPAFETMRYRSAQEVFMAIDSCFFVAEDSSPDRWMFLAALFAGHEEISHNTALGSWLRDLGELQVGGRTLTDWARAFSKLMRAALPQLEGLN
jgi:hypothetical protein